MLHATAARSGMEVEDQNEPLLKFEVNFQHPSVSTDFYDNYLKCRSFNVEEWRKFNW